MSVASEAELAPAARSFDPRARLLALLVVEVAAFCAASPIGAVLIVIATSYLARHADTPSRRWGALVLVAGGFVFAFGLNLLLIRSGHAVLALPLGIVLTDEGLARATRMGLRMANAGAFGLLFAYTTRVSSAAEAIGALTSPFARVFGDRVHTLAFQASMALGFVPILVGEARRIALAQRLRGLEIGRGPLARLRSLAPLFVPVFAQAVLRANRVATLLAVRGYQPGMRLPYLRGSRWLASDTLLVAGAALALLVALAFR